MPKHGDKATIARGVSVRVGVCLVHVTRSYEYVISETFIGWAPRYHWAVSCPDEFGAHHFPTKVAAVKFAKRYKS